MGWWVLLVLSVLGSHQGRQRPWICARFFWGVQRELVASYSPYLFLQEELLVD